MATVGVISTVEGLEGSPLLGEIPSTVTALLLNQPWDRHPQGGWAFTANNGCLTKMPSRTWFVVAPPHHPELPGF